MYPLTWASKEDPDHLAHSLIRFIIVRMKKLCSLACPKLAQWIFSLGGHIRRWASLGGHILRYASLSEDIRRYASMDGHIWRYVLDVAIHIQTENMILHIQKKKKKKKKKMMLTFSLSYQHLNTSFFISTFYSIQQQLDCHETST